MSSLNENELVYNQAVHIAGLIHKMREKLSLLPAEQQQLADWLHSNGSNAQLLESLQNREQLTAELEVLMQYDEDNAVAAIFNTLGEPFPAAAQKGKITRGRFLAAASVLLLIGLAAWFFLSKHAGAPSMAWQTITTAPGEQRQIALADGSEVWLSTASSIRFPANFTDNTREVTITGEAYFQVAKDMAKPFIVTANEMKIEVLGTRFDVMAYKEEGVTSVTLLEGSVKVGRKNKEESVVLKPGEQVSLSQSSQLFHPIPVQTEEVIAWQKGEFRFYETGMTAIMRQVARWYNVKVVYRGSVDSIHISGQVSRKENIKELLDILSDTRKVHFEIKDETVVVIPGRK